MKDGAATVMERCDLLDDTSEEPELIARPYGSQAMNEMNNAVAGWMRMAGMTTRRDKIGNLIGRYKGTGEKTLVLGSHLSTPSATPASMTGSSASWWLSPASDDCTIGENASPTRSRW